MSSTFFLLNVWLNKTDIERPGKYNLKLGEKSTNQKQTRTNTNININNDIKLVIIIVFHMAKKLKEEWNVLSRDM